MILNQRVNSTRIDPFTAKGLAGWVVKVADGLKNWAGTGALGLALLALAVGGLWCVGHMRAQRQRD